MNELQPNYEGMSKKELVSIIKSQKSELISQEAVIKEYKKHLEQVIEFSSVEKYRETVKRNQGVLGSSICLDPLNSNPTEKTFKEKLESLLNDEDLEPVEWSGGPYVENGEKLTNTNFVYKKTPTK